MTDMETMLIEMRELAGAWETMRGPYEIAGKAEAFAQAAMALKGLVSKYSVPETATTLVLDPLEDSPRAFRGNDFIGWVFQWDGFKLMGTDPSNQESVVMGEFEFDTFTLYSTSGDVLAQEPDVTWGQAVARAEDLIACHGGVWAGFRAPKQRI